MGMRALVEQRHSPSPRGHKNFDPRRGTYSPRMEPAMQFNEPSQTYYVPPDKTSETIPTK